MRVKIQSRDWIDLKVRACSQKGACSDCECQHCQVLIMGFGPRSCEFGNAVFAANERYVVSANSNTRVGDVSLFDAKTGSPVFMKLGLHVKFV